MILSKPILEALQQGAPKPAIIRAIREAGLLCATLPYKSDADNQEFEDVYLTNKKGIVPPTTFEVFNLLQQIERQDIEYLLRGGVITYTNNPRTGVSWEWCRSISN